MAAPRTRGTPKAKTKVTGGVKAQYKVTHANQTQRHNTMGFGQHSGYCGAAGYNYQSLLMPKIKDLCLSITPDAGRKIKFWLDIAKGEFAGMGVCGDIKEPLRITDFMLLDQRAGGAHADLNDRALNDYFVDMVKAGLQPVQFGRIWFHTHPFGGGTPSPSGGDDSTFERAFGDCQWSVMLIFSDTYGAYAEFQLPEALPSNYRLDVEYEEHVNPQERREWTKLFRAHVKTAARQANTVGGKKAKVKKTVRAKVKSGTQKINDALDLLDRRRLLPGGGNDLVDIDALDDEYERALETDAQEHQNAIRRILRSAH